VVRCNQYHLWVPQVQLSRYLPLVPENQWLRWRQLDLWVRLHQYHQLGRRDLLLRVYLSLQWDLLDQLILLNQLDRWNL